MEMDPALDLQVNDTQSGDQEKTTPIADSKTTSQAIIALPLSFKLANEDVVFASTISPRRKRRSTVETPEGWYCEVRTRKNGVVDRFYYHKETNVRCRSLKEVERYSLHGIRPGPKAKEKEMQIMIATAEKTAKQRVEEIHPSTETRGIVVAAGGNDKGNSKVHIPLMNKSKHQVIVEKITTEAWHNMTNPSDIRTEAWEEFEIMKEQEAEEEAMEMKLEMEREKMYKKFQEERQEMEKKFERERAEFHLWMTDEIDRRLQLKWEAMIPSLLLQAKRDPPPPGDSARS